LDRIDLDNWKAKEVARLLTLVENDRRYYQEILTSLPVAVAVITGEFNLVLVNRSFRLMFGLKYEELTDKRLDDVLPSPIVKERIQKQLELNTPETRIALTVTGTDGVSRPCHLSVIPLWKPYYEGPREALVAIVESEQATSPAAAILNELDAVVWKADVQTGELQFANAAAARLLNAGSLSSWADRVHPEDVSRVAWVYEAVLESGDAATVEYRAVRTGGDTSWFADRILPVVQQGKVTELRVITTEEALRRERIKRMVQNREMEAMMRLAQQVAHEFNNLWMIVNGYTEVVAERVRESDPETGSNLDVIQKAAERGIASTAQLLMFGRPPSVQAQPVDLHALFAKAQLPVDLRLMEGVAPVSVDPLKLESALRAILQFVNARMDTPNQPWIETGLTTQISDLADGLARGKFITARIGPIEKLTPKLVAHWCDPYFSEVGRAAPIGISLVYSQLRSMGVWMRMEPVDADHGVFLLEFPLARLPEPPKPEPQSPSQAVELDKKKPMPNLETILVVDDEVSIRSLVGRVLTRQGYEVIEASTAEEAIRISDRRTDKIGLVVSDVMLPGMRGPEMVKQLRHNRSTLRVLYISGYADELEMTPGVLESGEGFLQKPFTLQALTQTVRAVLDAPQD
jgi:two-component system, cell cycle sensor histidine kinase and response regulator CckA